jgi:hypothetical protein
MGHRKSKALIWTEFCQGFHLLHEGRHFLIEDN